jgi:hypothetical protein
VQHPVRDKWDTRHSFAAVAPGAPDEPPNVPNNIGGSRSWLTDSTAGSILRGTRRCLCSVRVGVSTLIWVLARLEELMDIRFRDTQSANASAETLFEVITDYSHYPHFNPAVVDVSVAESSNNGVEYTASRTPRILRDVRARDRYTPA